MSARKAAMWVVGFLTVAGVICVGLRLHVQPATDLQHADTFWRLTYAIDFYAAKPGARLRVAFPYDTPHNRVFRQALFFPGLRTERLRAAPSQARELGLVASRAGEQKLTIKFDLHLSPKARFRVREAGGPLTAEQRAALLRPESGIQVDDPAVLGVLQSLRQNLARNGDLVQRLHDFCHTELLPGEDAPNDAAGALRRKTATPLGRARALAALCRAAKLPARMISGFEIKSDATLVQHSWVEVLVGSRWEPFDPENGFAHELPHNFLAARRDGGEIVHGIDALAVHKSFSILRLPPSPGTSRAVHKGPLVLLDLTRLPLEMHEVLSLILLLPIGALVTAIFRTIIGLRTFGTFTPTLIALSFVFADWHTGIFVFGFVLALGLVSRSFLERLKLLMVPRLSVVLTHVVLAIVFTISLLEYFHLTPSAQAVLLPMVILTMTIERFFITSEEDGPWSAVKLLASTLAVSLCCYLVLRSAAAGELLLRFPELHLFTIAVLILIGHYTGYRLNELQRFRDLTQPPVGGAS